MNGSHAEIFDDVAVYALGTLPEAEAIRMREHLETCEECRDEYEALAATVTAVARSAESCTDATNGAVYASPLLKARIMREVRAQSATKTAPATSAPKVRSLVWPAYAISAACLVIALGFGAVNLSLTNRLHHLEATQQEAATTRTVDDATVADLLNERAKRYIVPGGEVVRSNNHVYIAMDDMPQPPAGKVYQTWTQPKGSKVMVPGATFVPDRHGVAILPISSNASLLHAIAVSIEPPGGSKAPTTSPVVLELLE